MKSNKTGTRLSYEKKGVGESETGKVGKVSRIKGVIEKCNTEITGKQRRSEKGASKRGRR